jgi:hypothetical protein
MSVLYNVEVAHLIRLLSAFSLAVGDGSLCRIRPSVSMVQSMSLDRFAHLDINSKPPFTSSHSLHKLSSV